MDTNNLIKTIYYKHNLSETRLLEGYDFNGSFKLSIDAPTGSGKSYYIIDYMKKNGIPFLFTTDTLLLMKSLASRQGVSYYCASEKESFNESQLITVYQHIPKFINRDMTLVIDEAHSLVSDYGWRKETVENVLTYTQGFKRVIFLSGTPLLSTDEAYNGIEQIKAIPEEIKERELEVVRYKEIVGGIVELASRAREDGSIPVVSFLDKSDKLLDLTSQLKKEGFNKIAIINSTTVKKTGGQNMKSEGEMENDIEVEGEPDYHEQLTRTGKVDADIIITTYRQGYDIKGTNYTLIIAPSKNRHSYTDIVQMMNRFRDAPGIKSYLLSNKDTKECKEFDYKKTITNKMNEITSAARKEIERLSKLKDSYRKIKLEQKLCGPIQEFIYDREYINHQMIAYKVFQAINNTAHDNLLVMKSILSTFNIKLVFNDMKTQQEVKEKPKGDKVIENEEEIKFAVNLFYQNLGLPGDEILISFDNKNKLFYKIQDCHDKLTALGFKLEEIKQFLLNNMIPLKKIDQKIECVIIKYGKDPDIIRYRNLLLSFFNIGERLTSGEIAGRINIIREKCNYPPLKEKTAVEFFNRLFETKRCRGEKDGKGKREIVNNF